MSLNKGIDPHSPKPLQVYDGGGWPRTSVCYREKVVDQDHGISGNPLDFYYKRLLIQIANTTRLKFRRRFKIPADMPVRHFGRSRGNWQGAYCAPHTLNISEHIISVLTNHRHWLQ